MSSIAGQIKSLPATRIDAWRLHLGALAAILLAMGVVFFPDIRAAAIVWWEYPAYSHCFLIIPISAWLIWERRASLAADTPAADLKALALALPVIAFWFVGRFASITEFRQFALVGMAEVFAIAILGRHIFAKISFACLYLFFLVPTGQYLIPPLQQVTAKFVQGGLILFHIPYFRDGLVFQLVNGYYEIAEACAGLRFLVATVALGALFAHLTYRKPRKIAIFIAACLTVPIFGNGLRALFTVVVANYTNNRVAAGIDHILYGWAFAVAIIFGLMYVGARYRDPEADIVPAAPAAGAAHPPHTAAFAATFIGALLLLSAGPAAAWLLENRPSTASQNELDAIANLPGWSRQAPSGDWHISFRTGAAQISTALAQEGRPLQQPVDLNVNYYIRSSGTPSLLAATNHSWNVNEWHPIAVRNARVHLGGTDVPFDEGIINAGSNRRMVWTTYWIDGRFTNSSLMTRLLEFNSGIAHGHSAVLAVSTPVTSSEEDARTRIRAALSAFPHLSASLTKVGDAPSATR